MRRLIAVTMFAVVLIVEGGSAALAGPIDLGTAGAFAVLGGSAVNNTGSSVIGGNLGLFPGTSTTGFPPGLVSGGAGATHVGDAVAQQAQRDLSTAYGAAAGLSCNVDLTGLNLGGMTLTAGTYCFASAAQLTGMLTLDAGNDPSAQFVFQIASTLTTASSSSVVFQHGGQGGEVTWQVGSSATIGSSTQFAGNILALTNITLNTTATINCGRALAERGAVTLDTNTVTLGARGCPAFTAATPTAVSEPGTAALLGSVLVAGGLMRRRRSVAQVGN